MPQIKSTWYFNALWRSKPDACNDSKRIQSLHVVQLYTAFYENPNQGNWFLYLNSWIKKSEVLWGYSRMILCLGGFQETAGGAVSSQSKHLISSKKKKGKGREREREKRTSTIPLIWCIWKLCSFNFFTAILSSCTYQNESKRPANLIGFCEQARTSQQGLFYLACSFLRKKALQLSLRSGRASQLSRVCLCAGGTSPHFKGSML